MQPVSGSPREGLFGATLGFFVGFAAVALFGPTAARFKEVMHLTPGMVGLLVAMPALSGSILRIPFSAWVDTTGGRKPFLVLLGLSIVGMLGLYLVVKTSYPDHMTPALYPLVAFLGILCGCGIATFSVGISQVSYWYPKSRQGMALGAYGGIGNLAPGMFSFLLPLILGQWGLSGAYLSWLLFLCFGTLLYFKTGRNAWYFQYLSQGSSSDEARQQAGKQGQEFFPAGSTTDSLKLSARIWKTWVLVGIYFTTFGGFIALTAWFPTYWNTYFQTGTVTAGLLTALYSILASVVRVPGGSVSDRLGGEKTALMSLSLTLLGALDLSFTASFPMAVAGAVAMGAGMGVANAAVFKLVPQEIPQAVGGAAGWVGGLGAFGGFAIPPIMGLAVDRLGPLGYSRGFLTFVVLALVSLGLALVLKRSRATQSAPMRVAISTTE